MMKSKRLLALLLAVMVIVGLLAVPAAAADVTGYANCPSCGRSGTYYVESHYVRSTRADSCPYHTGTHSHTLDTRYRVFDCPNCGSVSKDYETTSFCPYK